MIHSTVFGKLLGAFFGYLVAGPAGALVGIIVGNIFDQGYMHSLLHPSQNRINPKQGAAQKVFFKATFCMMGYIAKADGRVSQKEIHMARVLMDEMGLSRDQKEEAKAFFLQGKNKAFDVSAMLTELENACGNHPELLKLYVDIQYRAAKIDGLSEGKINTLDVILRRLGLAPLRRQYRFYQDFNYEDFEYGSSQSQSSSHRGRSHQPPPKSTLDQSYAILEVKKSAGQAEVKKAYRKLISKNHPDKLISQGLPEEMIKMANEKTQKIRKAYEAICKSKGWHH